MPTLARWCFRHRYWTIGAWLALLVVLIGGSSALGGSAYGNSFALAGTGSANATDLLQKSVPAQAGDADTIVWKADTGTVRDAAVKPRIEAMLTKVAALPHVTGVVSPYGATSGTHTISANGTIAYATVTFDQQSAAIPKAAVKKVISTAEAARTGNLQVELGGQAISRSSQKAGGFSELIGVIAAAIVLFIAFGSLLSMLVPLATAIAGILAGIELTSVLSHTFSIASLAPTLSALIGLGVGIDYALFIITRHRNGVKAGKAPEDAAVAALNTSGRAVLFAGGTVCIALLGLLALGVGFLNGVAVGAALTVVFAVIAAVTLLPALLGVLGTRVLNRRDRTVLAAGPIDAYAGSGWTRWSSLVQRRPHLLAGPAIVIMLAIAIPTLSIRLGAADAGSDPTSQTTHKAYELTAEGFGAGYNGPLLVVADHAAGVDAAGAATLRATLTSTPNVASVVPLVLNKPGDVSIFDVYPKTSPQAKETTTLIKHLRNDVLPPFERSTSTTVYVGGSTATFADFASVITGKLPLFIGIIIALGALLLMLAFRSLVIPLTAAVMNLVAAAAAFGVVVLVFQKGWGSDALGLGGSGPIEAFVPVLLLAILFGLSMDYQVFLVSRMHEEWTNTHDNARAVRVGQAETGKVITAAATIMICVFLAFLFLGQRAVGEFGIGLASAVALDAFILRSILVPAMMHIFGDANWYLPSWLDRILPHMSVEPAEEAYPGGLVEQAPGPVLLSPGAEPRL